MQDSRAAKVAIIGAGPGGLIAAEYLAKQGYAVALYDQMPSPARKFLIAGRGGLNLTHSEPFRPFLARYGNAQAWLAPSITAFTPEDLRAWCEGLGVETFVGSSGRIFPRSMKAVPLLRAWLARLADYGVDYYPRHRWCGWTEQGLAMTNAEGETMTLQPDAALFALGGASWARLGSDAAWVTPFRAAGIAVETFQPSNCGFDTRWSANFAERFAGVPLKPVQLEHAGMFSKGEAMITARGIEGGAVYAVSSSIRKAVLENGCTTLRVDLKPDLSHSALTVKLERARSSKSFSTTLKRCGLSAVGISLLREAFPVQELQRFDAEALAHAIKRIPLKITGIAGIERAISSAGGIRQEAVTADFMLKTMPGNFVAGEMLDWEAPTGGYLLQACFSTGVAAAKGMVRYMSKSAKMERAESD